MLENPLKEILEAKRAFKKKREKFTKLRRLRRTSTN